jgi:hypothetical protein
MSEASGVCRYRGDGGLMCGVGPLIPEEAYSPMLEGCPAELLPRAIVPELKRVSTRRLLAALQDLHDHEPPCMWRAELAELARRCGLTMPEATA